LLFLPLPRRKTRRLAKKCSFNARHATRSERTAKNVVGPVLNGAIGRTAGSVPGYSYSEANKQSGLTWDEATFREYIKALFGHDVGACFFPAELSRRWL
jgi:cytochrome c2